MGAFDRLAAQFEKVLQEKVDVVFDLIGGDTQKRSFLVSKEGGHLVSAMQPVSQEEAAKHRVTGLMMRLAPSGAGLGKIAGLREEGTIRPDIATVYALEDAAQAWKDIAGNLPGVHGTPPSRPGAEGRKSHGKIVLRVAQTSPGPDLGPRADPRAPGVRSLTVGWKISGPKGRVKLLLRWRKKRGHSHQPMLRPSRRESDRDTITA